MKKELKEKLKKYSSVSGVLLLGNSNLSAQISYTDLNPDLILHDLSAVYPIDLDGDLQDDFNLFAGFGSQTGTFASGPYYGQQFIDYANLAMAGAININNEFQVDSMYNNDALDFNEPINSLQDFNNFYSYMIPLAVKNTRVAQSAAFSSTSIIGIWNGKFDKYLGIRFQIGGNIHYGWIRMDVTADCDSIIIKDYAYNTVPNQGILAGQTAVSVAEMESEISIHAYQKSLYIRKNAEEQEQLQIFSLDGKMVFEKTVSDKNEIVSLQDLPKGVYVVQFGELAKKIVL